VLKALDSASVSQVVLEALDKPRRIKFKGALDLVTETDVASEKAVLEVSIICRYMHEDQTLKVACSKP
jgi:hypothetical protein